MAIILFIIFLRYRVIIKIANQLVDLNAALLHFRTIYKVEKGKIRLLLIFCGNTFFCVCLIVCEFFSHHTIFPPIFLFVNVHRIIFSYFLIQYALILTFIEKRFRGINNAFLKLKKTENEVECRTYDTPKIPLDRMCIVEIIGLKRSYSFLYKLCTKIADYYSLGIIIILPYFTAAIITTIYDLILSFLQVEAYKKSMLRRVVGILWFFIETFPILALSTCATSITMEMRKTSDIVQKILYYCSMSNEIRKELKHFLLELLHKDFQFTAYNVVSIDSTMLRTMFSAVVTYLIILIQFQVGEIEKAARD
ncbi:gustatory and pheromone receptor 32a-like [Chelonus insularis]|uniref:gustatory and pheromone receptor 32a-like n=1 Tax=Chelonus insularis TaxID=460826 RepID=UPI00158AAF91|nr:gustatory and pheromone receptor 32a-like [Chelonus insularis]